MNSTIDSAYRADIDGLRAVAVLSILGFHFAPAWVSGGFFGVDVFFVISGFLITRIVLREVDNSTFDIFEFYVRRIRRIFPALGLVLISCLAIGWLVLLADEYQVLGRDIASGAGFASNLVSWMDSESYFR